jgi:hypothetical protein
LQRRKDTPMKYVFWITLVIAAGIAGWRIIQPEITNLVFQDELQDSAAQLGWRTGVSPPSSDEELRNIVIRKAAKHDIALEPKQVTVRHTGTGEYTSWYIAVDYTVPVNLLVYSFDIHFAPTSKGRKLGGVGISSPASNPVPAKDLPKPDQQKQDQPQHPRQPPELKEKDIPPSLKRPLESPQSVLLFQK